MTYRDYHPEMVDRGNFFADFNQIICVMAIDDVIRCCGQLWTNKKDTKLFSIITSCLL